MEKLSKQRILKGTIAFLMVAFSFIYFWSIEQAVHNPFASKWIAPVIFFTLFLIPFLIMIILVKDNQKLYIMIFATIFQSLWFAQSASHVGILIISGILLVFAAHRVNSELELRIKLKFNRTLAGSMSTILVCLTLITSSVFFFQIQKLLPETMIERIQVGSAFRGVVSEALGFINSEFRQMTQDDVTVDEYFRVMAEKQWEDLKQSGADDPSKMQYQVGDKIVSGDQVLDAILEARNLTREDLSPEELTAEEAEIKARQDVMASAQEEQQRNFILEQSIQDGRENISEYVGIELTGDEKIVDVFVSMIDRKLRTLAYNQVVSDAYNVPIVPLVTAVLLFTTLLPFVLLFKFVWLWLVSGLMRLFIKLKWFRVYRMSKLVEVLE